ncbi:DUF362 domain-containing protein [Halorarum halophilum]|uniref:DUF362 domain-containing protein n=1 Tax=Halorarum halophilum TaxID=2743090 RepID=A0A7D5K7B7_9EURY|nr:DUF362 domain-containing protein [Halobaculum halophilum]QLG27339.1 DUF362 domain-containing protein [Halobaculum halophilum]
MTERGDPTVGPIPEETILEVCGERDLPRMGVIEQIWETDPIPIDEVESRAAEAVDSLALDEVPDGGEIAVGAGSRGIANLPAIVRGVVGELQSRGYEPFVFPAMGSHGGATADGQRGKLDALGVSEETVGCEVRATMEVVEVGTTPERGVSVVADANAAAADGIVPINRVKPHTDFDGRVESGLSKMLVIGMGKQRGAKFAHEGAVNWSFREMIPQIARILLDALPVVGGIAAVENQHDDTAILEGVPPSGFLEREAELLETAYEKLPTLPFDDLDVLVVDQMGKEISGTGMDTNVVGRREFGFEPEPESPTIGRIYVRSLTEPSHGNATALGMADLVHRDLIAETDLSKAVINTVTASNLRGARVPPIMESDYAALVAALSTVGIVGPEEVRVARVTDTMRLERLYVSEALIEEARERDDLRVVAEPEPVEFDGEGGFTAPPPSPDAD